MSGRKQHFIPQSLLKGFGFEKGKNTYVVAYTYDRGTFSPATEGIGAERHFYSELNVEGEGETLDDRITGYEQPFPKILATLRAVPHGQSADTKMTAEFVTHLAVRNDHFRKSVATGGANLIEGMAGALTDEEKAKAMFGLSGDQPSELFAGELARVWTQFQPIFAMMGMSEAQFNAWAYQLVKGNFASFHDEMVGPLSEMFKGMVQKLPALAAASQRRSLAGGLSPPLRVLKMSEFEWRVLHPETSLVLPDCVSVAFDAAGEVVPLMLADLEATESVLMPLSSERLLIGSRGTTGPPPQGLNDAFASCSWDFFVARDRTEELEKSRELLRTRVADFLGDTVNEVLHEAIAEGAGSKGT